jgi:hypothetical protein
MIEKGSASAPLSLSKAWLSLVLSLWFVAALAGTINQAAPREALVQTSDGEPVDSCFEINPELVTSGGAEATDWCTSDSLVGRGPRIPTKGVEVIPGDIRFAAYDFLPTLLRALLLPDLWLTWGVGGAALLSLFFFARATGTLRAGLAAAISVVFLGILLFPTYFTARIPPDMRAELVKAWQWVILFYFGSEAAVQAWKVTHPEGANVTGDMKTGTHAAHAPENTVAKSTPKSGTLPPEA